MPTLGDKIQQQLKSNFNAVYRLYMSLKWMYLIVIALATGAVGFSQSLLVGSLYRLRSEFIYNIMRMDENMAMKYFQYVGFNVLLAFGCCMALYWIAPAASGSGIPDIKAYLNGVESPIFVKFFQIRTFIAKVIGAALAVSSSLVMGKEGPMLHIGSTLAVTLGNSKWLRAKMEEDAHWGTFTYNKELRDLVACGAACGVAAAMRAPVGGVLFAMEMSSRWRKELTWRCFLAAAITIVIVRWAISWCSTHDMSVAGHCEMLKFGALAMFLKQSYPNPYEQVWAVIILAAIAGYLGCLFTSFNTWVCIVRKRWGKQFKWRILEVCIISVITSTIFYFLPLLGTCKRCLGPPGQCMKRDNAASSSMDFLEYSGFKCDGTTHYNDMAVLIFNPQGFVVEMLFTDPAGSFSMPSLLVYGIVFWLLACITYGAFIPSGLFTPSLIFGGLLGRLFAKILLAMGAIGESHVGLYAIIGAASFMGGLMRMSAAMALILMEMSQAPNLLPFLMIAVIVSKYVGDKFNYSVFDHQIMLKNLPFMGFQSEEEIKKTHLSAHDVMEAHDDKGAPFFCIRESVEKLRETVKSYPEVAAFAVVSYPQELFNGRGNFIGLISRSNVEGLLAQNPDAEVISLLEKVEISPVVIPPEMPLPFVYRILNQEGFTYLPVIKMHGPLEGIVTRHQICEVQTRNDKFHLKEQIEFINRNVEEGRILQSMQLGENVHAQYFKNMVTRPKEFVESIFNKPLDEEQPQEQFFVNSSHTAPSDRDGQSDMDPLLPRADRSTAMSTPRGIP